MIRTCRIAPAARRSCSSRSAVVKRCWTAAQRIAHARRGRVDQVAASMTERATLVRGGPSPRQMSPGRKRRDSCSRTHAGARHMGVVVHHDVDLFRLETRQPGHRRTRQPGQCSGFGQQQHGHPVALRRRQRPVVQNDHGATERAPPPGLEGALDPSRGHAAGPQLGSGEHAGLGPGQVGHDGRDGDQVGAGGLSALQRRPAEHVPTLDVSAGRRSGLWITPGPHRVVRACVGQSPAGGGQVCGGGRVVRACAGQSPAGGGQLERGRRSAPPERRDFATRSGPE